MGIFSGSNRDKGQSPTTTLIAEGCSINGHIRVENQIQIDGRIEGRIEAVNQLRISKSGQVQGDIITKHIIINGEFEGICHAERVEILNSGRVSGTIYSDNLSIEPGGKFTGVTNPSDNKNKEAEIHELTKEKVSFIDNMALLDSEVEAH